MIVMCRHCHRRKATRARGLCWPCYFAPGVRDQYPLDKFHVRGIEDFYGCATPPTTPTDALPGTPEKIGAMMERARLKQSLWHPLDARTKDSPLADGDVSLPALDALVSGR